jgi:hypothetical protein
MNDFTATDFEVANHAGHVMSQVKIKPKGKKDT